MDPAHLAFVQKFRHLFGLPYNKRRDLHPGGWWETELFALSWMPPSVPAPFLLIRNHHSRNFGPFTVNLLRSGHSSLDELILEHQKRLDQILSDPTDRHHTLLDFRTTARIQVLLQSASPSVNPCNP